MRRSVTTSLLTAAAGAALLLLSACQAKPATTPISAPSPQMLRVDAALKAWPTVPDSSIQGLRRPFFCTIHVFGQRMTASGVLDYHNPRDFRLTAVTELGAILFDVRFNWAGATVLRQMPGLPKSSIQDVASDLSTAFQPPPSLEGLTPAHGGSELVLKRTLPDTKKYTWTFEAASGRLRQVDVDMGGFDTLRLQIHAYDQRGWPSELTMTRKARFYTINLSFTEQPIARGKSTARSGATQ